MVPEVLSEDLSSLRAGADRLAFSVFWEMDSQANILSSRVGRDHDLLSISATFT